MRVWKEAVGDDGFLDNVYIYAYGQQHEIKLHTTRDSCVISFHEMPIFIFDLRSEQVFVRFLDEIFLGIYREETTKEIFAAINATRPDQDNGYVVSRFLHFNRSWLIGKRKNPSHLHTPPSSLSPSHPLSY